MTLFTKYILPIIISIIIFICINQYNNPSINNNPLFDSVYRGDLLKVINILNNNTIASELINQRDEWNNTVLHIAVKSTASISIIEEIIDRLLASGANLTAVNNAGTGILHWAAANTVNNNDRIISKLLELGLSINNTNIAGETALFWSIEFNNYNISKYLITAGIDINTARDQYNNTAFHKIPINCDTNLDCINLVELLLLYSADPTIRNKSNRTPLQYFNWKSINNTNIKSIMELYNNRIDNNNTVAAAESEFKAKLSSEFNNI